MNRSKFSWPVVLCAVLLCLSYSSRGEAQTGFRVTTCGQAGVAPPQTSPLFIDANGNLCVVGGGTAPGTSGATAQSIQGTTGGVPVATTTTPGTRVLVPLTVATVTTGGTAVTALTAGQRSAGGWLYNPTTATIPLCINEVATASGTTTAGSLICIPPDRTYNLTPSANAVSVVSSDSAHPFGGFGLQ